MTLRATEERVMVWEQSRPGHRDTLEASACFVEFVNACPEPTEPHILRRTPEVVEEVIFEADIEGVHYFLVRCQPQAPVMRKISLSPREAAIARLVVKGLPNKSIGDVLDISPWTVATHLRRIFSKLDVTSRAAMVARLLEDNML